VSRAHRAGPGRVRWAGHWPRPWFVVREAARAARRHVGTAVAIVVTATLSLAMLGGALLVRAQIDSLKGAWYDTTQVAVYLTGDASAGQVAALGDALEADPLVEQVWFEDQQTAYANFTDQFADSPDLVAEVTPDQLPRSYRLSLVDPETGDQITARYADRAGVRQVVDEHAQLATLFDVLGGFATAALVLAVIQAAAAVVLIVNMVSSTVLLRARELRVGRVMGATRTQLAVPFLAEVACYGLAGAGGAVAILAVAKVELVDQRLAASGVLSGIVGYVGWDALWGTLPWLLVAGVGVPVAVTAGLLWRHLHR